MLLRTDIFNALASDLNLDGLDQLQTDILAIDIASGLGRQSDLQVDLVDQITVTGDLASHALTEAARTIDVDTQAFALFLSSDV